MCIFSLVTKSNPKSDCSVLSLSGVYIDFIRSPRGGDPAWLHHITRPENRYFETPPPTAVPTSKGRKASTTPVMQTDTDLLAWDT